MTYLELQMNFTSTKSTKPDVINFRELYQIVVPKHLEKIV